MKDCSALLDSSAACTGGSGKVVEVFWLDFSRLVFFFVGGGTGHEDKQFEMEKERCLKCSDKRPLGFTCSPGNKLPADLQIALQLRAALTLSHSMQQPQRCSLLCKAL